MKKVIIAILAVAFSATLAFAGPAERLNLTPEQKQQWVELRKSYHQQMKQLRQEQEQKLMAILTDEQKAQFEQMKAERRERREHRRQR
jgi:Spy/CpxP family protein refolding chaperone